MLKFTGTPVNDATQCGNFKNGCAWNRICLACAIAEFWRWPSSAASMKYAANSSLNGFFKSDNTSPACEAGHP